MTKKDIKILQKVSENFWYTEYITISMEEWTKLSKDFDKLIEKLEKNGEENE